MPYTVTTWVEGATSVGPTHLNHIESGIASAPYGPDASANQLPVWNGSAWVYQQIADAQISSSAAISLSKLAQGGATATQVLAWSGSAWVPTTPGGASSTPPTGVVTMYGGTSAPTGALLCDGASYSRTTFAALFAVCGIAYGAVDGSHFNVPDMRGRMPAGYAASGGHTDVSTMGLTEGSAVANRRPKHPHTNSVTATPSLTLPNHGHSVSDPTHSHSADYYRANGAGDAAHHPGRNTDDDLFTTFSDNAASTGISVGNPTSNPGIPGTVGIGGTIGAAGSATDTPAYNVVNFIIWT